MQENSTLRQRANREVSRTKQPERDPQKRTWDSEDIRQNDDEHDEEDNEEQETK